MSQPSAIAAVTETLRALIAAEGVVSNVTALPPDQAGSPGDRRVNLFLYHLGISSALRNQEFPWQGRSGGDSQQNPPPFTLPLQLHYLLTVHADDEVAAHEVLGPAMRVLHDHAQLTGQEIRDAAQAAGLNSDLHLQSEKVKVTPLNMSTDEMMKIWTAFQSPYRLSVGYEVSVVLIESARPSVSPLPVLRRGAEDRGPVAIAGNSVPVITALLRSDGSSPFTTGFAGTDLIIEGVNLGESPRIRLRLASDVAAAGATILTTAKRIAPGAPGGSSTAERLRLPLTAADLPAAGPLVLCLEVPDAVQPTEDVGSPPVAQPRWWHSNEVGLSIAPRITSAPGPAVPGPNPGEVVVTLNIEPGVRATQRAVLLLNGTEHPVTTIDATTPGAPEFTIAAPAAGTYAVRLRLDGVDMPELIKDPAKSFFEFAPGKEVVIP